MRQRDHGRPDALVDQHQHHQHSDGDEHADQTRMPVRIAEAEAGGHAGHREPLEADLRSLPATAEPAEGLTRVAVAATLHCLTGCAIGEVLGLALATWWGWSNVPSVLLAVALAFVFGYALTMGPVLRSGLGLRRAVQVALAADTVSIVTMEVVDNAVVLAVPGAMDAGLSDPLFWGSLAVALAVAFAVTVPVNRALIVRGKGHAAVQGQHGQH
ncbi:MAG: DUF4396 domain-containing protein [Motilibacteraceae bacterium]